MNSKNSNDKVPDLIYNELVELYGKEKADEIIEKKGVDFRYLPMRMYANKLNKKVGINFWVLLVIVALLIVLSSII